MSKKVDKTAEELKANIRQLTDFSKERILRTLKRAKEIKLPKRGQLKDFPEEARHFHYAYDKQDKMFWTWATIRQTLKHLKAVDEDGDVGTQMLPHSTIEIYRMPGMAIWPKENQRLDLDLEVTIDVLEELEERYYNALVKLGEQVTEAIDKLYELKSQQ